ncbi:hypothetical protein HpHA4_10830 [Helicobacter pylori]
MLIIKRFREIHEKRFYIWKRITYSHCGSINPKLKLNHRQYLCSDCGYKEHRDINAANNIFIKGLSLFRAGNVLADFKEQSLSC